MIYGRLDNIGIEEGLYPEPIRRGLAYLRETDLSALPVGVHHIDGDSLIARVAEYETEPEADRRPERHERYIDIQCVAFGEERIGLSRMSDTGAVYEDRRETDDYVLYESTENETFVTLTAGMFAVCFPWDVHRPNCATANGTTTVKKIVMKVRGDFHEAIGDIRP